MNHDTFAQWLKSKGACSEGYAAHHHQATPRPWDLWGKPSEDNPSRLIACDGGFVAQTIGQDDDANAALIVTAVNGWDDPEALKARIEELNNQQETR